MISAPQALADPTTTPVRDVPEAFAAVFAEAFARRPGERFTVLLSGGPTARACYQALGPTSAQGQWDKVDVLIGDERWVPAEDPDANQRLVREALVDRLGPVGSFTPMPTGGTPEEAAAAYQAVLAERLAGDGLDLVHLGLGPDGHTASLFAGDPGGLGGPSLVRVAQDPSGQNPHQRLTVTLEVIEAARLVVFTVAGPTKRAALAAVRAGAPVPAAAVRAAQVRWIVDAAAFGPHEEVP